MCFPPCYNPQYVKTDHKLLFTTLCKLNCDKTETKIHTFESCKPGMSRLNLAQTIPVNIIYDSPCEQKKAAKLF